MLSGAILLLLVFINNYTNSATNNLGISHIRLLCGDTHHRLRHVLRPHSIKIIGLRKQQMSSTAMRNANTCLALCLLLFTTVFFIVDMKDPFSVRAGFTSTISYFGGMNPNLKTANPTNDCTNCSSLSATILSITVLLNHLRVCPLLLALVPTA